MDSQAQEPVQPNSTDDATMERDKNVSEVEQKENTDSLSLQSQSRDDSEVDTELPGTSHQPEDAKSKCKKALVVASTDRQSETVDTVELVQEVPQASTSHSNNVVNKGTCTPPEYKDNQPEEESPPSYEDYIKHACQQNCSHSTCNKLSKSQCQKSSLDHNCIQTQHTDSAPKCSHQNSQEHTPSTSESNTLDQTEIDTDQKTDSSTSACNSGHPNVKPSPSLSSKRARFHVSRVTNDSASICSNSSSVFTDVEHFYRYRSVSAGSQSLPGLEEVSNQAEEVFTVEAVPSTNNCSTAVVVVEVDALSHQQGDGYDCPEYGEVVPGSDSTDSGILREHNTGNYSDKLQPMYKRNHLHQQHRRSPTNKALKELARQHARRPSIDLSKVVSGVSVIDIEDTNGEEVFADTDKTKPALKVQFDSDSGRERSNSLFQQNITHFGKLGGDGVVVSVGELPWLKKPSCCVANDHLVLKPNDNMALSCLVLFCCNFVFGLAAFGFSVATNTTYEKGDYGRAICYAKTAKVLALLGVAITFVAVVAILVIYWPEKQEEVHKAGIYGM